VKNKHITPKTSVCPVCGADNSWPMDMDSWYCLNCDHEYPTTAFKCRHPDCWEYVFLDEYCEAHKSHSKNE